jgi:hypothetical protein
MTLDSVQPAIRPSDYCCSQCRHTAHDEDGVPYCAYPPCPFYKTIIPNFIH